MGNGTFDSKTLDGVRLLGQEVQELSLQEGAPYIGYWAGIQIDARTGLLQAAGTAELPSYAKGY